MGNKKLGVSLCGCARVAPRSFRLQHAFPHPRAGLGGGNVIRNNLLWNSCRESQDHGPINTWSRVPYVTTVRNGTASTVPDYTYIGPGNFIVAGGASRTAGCARAGQP